MTHEQQWADFDKRMKSLEERIIAQKVMVQTNDNLLWELKMMTVAMKAIAKSNELQKLN